MKTVWFAVFMVSGIIMAMCLVLYMYIWVIKGKHDKAWKMLPLAMLFAIIMAIAGYFRGQCIAEEKWDNAVKENYTFYLDGDIVSPTSLDKNIYLDDREYRPIYIEETKKVLLTSEGK